MCWRGPKTESYQRNYQFEGDKGKTSILWKHVSIKRRKGPSETCIRTHVTCAFEYILSVCMCIHMFRVRLVIHTDDTRTRPKAPLCLYPGCTDGYMKQTTEQRSGQPTDQMMIRSQHGEYMCVDSRNTQISIGCVSCLMKQINLLREGRQLAETSNRSCS